MKFFGEAVFLNVYFRHHVGVVLGLIHSLKLALSMG